MAKALSFALALTLSACATPAAAQEVSELRSQVAALRAHRPDGISDGVLTSIEYTLDVAERIRGRFPEQSASWQRRAARFIEQAQQGVDPFPLLKGKITDRGYVSRMSTIRQGYAIYLPEDYDPSRSYPLMLCMHGGSSNGNLFLGVVMGNNMDWLTYSQHLWDDYVPRWQAPFIVVAPTGYGQVMWRWMGEKEVFDVIDDVEREYNVDPDRVILSGLSNGGVGAYAIGTRHAWRFSAVLAIAGAPSWLQYTGGHPLTEERAVMEPLSGMHLVENTVNTTFRYYHGRSDTGPMRPAYTEAFQRRVEELGLPNHVTWYDAGHDILYFVIRHGLGFPPLAELHRDRRPTDIKLRTGDYRAARQHWVTVTRMERYPELASVDAHAEGATLTLTTQNVLALSVDLRDAPVTGDTLAVQIDGQQAFQGPRAQAGHVLHLVRRGEGWRNGYPDEPEGTLVKRPGLSGPLTDPYFDRMVHVYGTADPEHTDELRRNAERGARGWPLSLWDYEQEVVADTDVDEAMMADATLVLYGTERDNALLNRMWEQLPIKVHDGAVLVGTQRFEGPDVGVRFVYPNPLHPDRYVIVQAGVTTDAVTAGHNLPDFVPDWVVYDRHTTHNRPRLILNRNTPRSIGLFDRHWRLPAPPEGGNDGGMPTAPVDAGTAATDAGEDAGEPLLPIPRRPPTPPMPRTFLAPETDPAGVVARQMAALIRTFYNFRAEIPGGTWRVDRDHVWQIRPQQECLDDLRAKGIAARVRPGETTPVPVPVELLGPVDGVWFQSLHEDRPLIISCEMASRLPVLVEVLKSHGVRGVEVMSAYRDHPRPSFHTMGLALDMSRFWTDRGWISVRGSFLETPGSYTCHGPAGGRRGRTLLRIACDLWATRTFSTILTPNYNEGHRDHFHIDARPDDFRFYLR